MKNKRILIYFIALILLMTVAAAWHLSTRTEAPSGGILVIYKGQEIPVPFGSLALSGVQGTIVNGKGEEKIIEAPGMRVSDLLASVDADEFSSVTVAASDEYRALLTAKEILEPGKVWLTVEDDGSLRLIVFGDPDSKRSVADVERMEVQ